MYVQILKRDIKRKKTMNVILLIFVILAATFIAGSANNLLTVSSALDNFIDRAGAPDYWFASTNASDIERFEEYAGENGYRYHISKLIQIEPKNVFIENEKFEYSNTLVLSTLGGTRIYDKNDKEITHINDGEIYITSFIFHSEKNDFHEGGKIRISQGGIEKEFTIKGYTKDALFGSSMAGITRFLVSKNDAELFRGDKAVIGSSVEVHTKDDSFRDKFNALAINTIMSVDHSMFKMMYFMDILMAAILLVVGVCLILFSMVILRFIINFTIAEDFREIGVMKAIGLKNSAIRGLYIVKYFVLAFIGTAVGMGLSFPFSRAMVSQVSEKIVISSNDNFFINIGAAVLVCIFVVLFCYFCTRKICKFSPIDAIHSGETGERFKKKGMFHLENSHMPTVLFMAVNDVFSGMKSCVSMIIIFIIGILLVIIPVNTINTLRSDKLIVLFNMAESDHVISQELLFHPDEDNKTKVEQQLSGVRDMFKQNGIDAEVFQEIMFRSNILKGDKRTNSLSFQGMGGVTTDRYTYMDGTPPQNAREVALTYLVAEQIDAEIGDEVMIKVGEDTKTYTVTAISQSMTNMGEGVRFYQDAELDYDYAAGCFGIQVQYKDDPDKAALASRRVMLEKLFPDAKIYTSGEYVSYMIGDVAGQLSSMKMLILSLVLGINVLVAVLMVKSFITREKGEIALLKAIGFRNYSLIIWQTMRIGIVLAVSVLLGALVSPLLSSLIITPIFRMMGAYSIEFKIRAVEVYVVYPFIVLAATASAAFISAQGVRKISSSQISNSE